MDEAKERILEIYREAAKDAYKALEQSVDAEDTEESGMRRELFAEKYGRRQAYGRVLKEVFGVPKEELQRILDDINR